MPCTANDGGEWRRYPSDFGIILDRIISKLPADLPTKSDTFSPFPQDYDKLEHAGYIVNQIKNLHIHPHIP
jgi:hypothetical protein